MGEAYRGKTNEPLRAIKWVRIASRKGGKRVDQSSSGERKEEFYAHVKEGNQTRLRGGIYRLQFSRTDKQGV